MEMLKENPFFVKTPERMSAKEVVELFVPLPDYLSIQDTGHNFIHGHRGCGKSMMFRFMSPDSQVLYHKKEIKELPYFGVYLSIKATDLNLGELGRLENQISGFILSEHFLVSYFVVKTLKAVKKNVASIIDKENLVDELRSFCQNILLKKLEIVGWQNDVDLDSLKTSTEIINKIIGVFDTIHAQSSDYFKKLLLNNDIVPYTGILLSFQDLLLPMMSSLKRLSFMPNKPIFLLIDDADNLNLTQTKVLNTWVSYRSTETLSLKISTQLNYKTYLTANGQRIESSHDFSEINISNVYTGKTKENYPSWVENIVSKRLKLSGINISARDFFPVDEKQEKEIEKLAIKRRKDWKEKGIGNKPDDDAYRYARPDYIKQCGGGSKHSYSYLYAGFDQLVHISSGIIRYFLDPSLKMFSAEKTKIGNHQVKKIPPSTQNEKIREYADSFLESEFDSLVRSLCIENPDSAPEITKKLKHLRNLIKVIGETFYLYLIDQSRTERRYFSFTISTYEPDPYVLDIIKLGIDYGYLYESYIGRKDGFGRTSLYVLSRRLAPYFKLDPIGFSAYKSFSSDFLSRAIHNPMKAYSEVKESADPDKIVEEDKPLFREMV